MSGTSHPFGKGWAADLYAVVRPGIVVDIGAGSGTWHRALSPRHVPTAWVPYWIAVEVFPEYVVRYELMDAYDEVAVCDARDYVHALGPFGPETLVIAGDVLEHMPQEDAEKMLAALDDCHVLVSVPVIRYDQGEIDGNVHEAHLWHPTHEWAMDMLRPAAHVVGDVVGAYWRVP